MEVALVRPMSDNDSSSAHYPAYARAVARAGRADDVRRPSDPVEQTAEGWRRTIRSGSGSSSSMQDPSVSRQLPCPEKLQETSTPGRR